MEKIDSGSRKVKEYLGMKTRPVGVKLMRQDDVTGDGCYDVITGKQSFCWFVHQSAGGKNFLICREDLDCNKAEIVLGFREPIFAKIEPRIKVKVSSVRIGPLEDADNVMLVLNPEQAMTLANLVPGINVAFKWNKTVCGDGMAFVYNHQQPSMSLLCIGARTDGGFNSDELLVTLHGKTFLELPSKMNKLSSLSRMALDSLSERFGRVH
jgi:uncharacterized protein (DUF169 family)